jgi:hypothetical protein
MLGVRTALGARCCARALKAGGCTPTRQQWQGWCRTHAGTFAAEEGAGAALARVQPTWLLLGPSPMALNCALLLLAFGRYVPVVLLGKGRTSVPRRHATHARGHDGRLVRAEPGTRLHNHLHTCKFQGHCLQISGLALLSTLAGVAIALRFRAPSTGPPTSPLL